MFCAIQSGLELNPEKWKEEVLKKNCERLTSSFTKLKVNGTTKKYTLKCMGK